MCRAVRRIMDRSPTMRRFDAPAVGYTTPVTPATGVAGFSSLKHSCSESRSSVSSPCGFVVCASSFWWLGRGAREGSPVSARSVRSATRSSHRHPLAGGAVVVANHTPWRPSMAHSLSLPARTSARVIPLPNAAQHPVQQHRGPGRRPPHIINLSRWKLDRKFPDMARSVDTPASVEQARAFVQTCERLLQEARAQYMVAQQRAVVQTTSRNVRSSLNPTWSDR